MVSLRLGVINQGMAVNVVLFVNYPGVHFSDTSDVIVNSHEKRMQSLVNPLNPG